MYVKDAPVLHNAFIFSLTATGDNLESLAQELKVVDGVVDRYSDNSVIVYIRNSEFILPIGSVLIVSDNFTTKVISQENFESQYIKYEEPQNTAQKEDVLEKQIKALENELAVIKGENESLINTIRGITSSIESLAKKDEERDASFLEITKEILSCKDKLCSLDIPETLDSPKKTRKQKNSE